ncbi:hypothetical protein Ddc_12648 [Ditylenchus destructor]|nr:hypothetical protein Ddc_12648 [Ditylenchus destructor]
MWGGRWTNTFNGSIIDCAFHGDMIPENGEWFVDVFDEGRVEKFGQARTNGTGYFFLFEGDGVDPSKGHPDHVELRIENNCAQRKSGDTVRISIPWDQHMCKFPCPDRQIFNAGNIKLDSH